MIGHCFGLLIALALVGCSNKKVESVGASEALPANSDAQVSQENEVPTNSAGQDDDSETDEAHDENSENKEVDQEEVVGQEEVEQEEVEQETKVLVELKPNEILDLMLWLDALDPFANGVGAASGDDLPIWHDKSPNMYNFTPSPTTTAPKTSNLFLGNKMGIQFQGEEVIKDPREMLRNNDIDHRQSVASVLTSVTVYEKHELTGGERPTIWAAHQNGFTSRRHSMELAAENVPIIEIMEIKYDAAAETSQVQIWQNGVLISSEQIQYDEVTRQTFPGMAIGCHLYPPTENGFYCGAFVLGEMILYARALSSDELEQLTNHLSIKWEIPLIEVSEN